MNVLVLCHGNINRSPVCAAMLGRQQLLNVQQAALKEFKRPERAAKKMREGVLRYDIDLEDHRSQPITEELYEWADLCVVMDNGNMMRLLKFHEMYFEGLSRKPIVRLGWFLSPQVDTIKDPNYMKGASPEFDAVVAQVVRASHRLARDLVSDRDKVIAAHCN